MNIIPLSETKDYKYIGIPVPRDAESMSIIPVRDRWNFIYRSEYNKKIFFIDANPLWEIIGILGETLTEEQATEIVIAVEWDKYSTEYIKKFKFSEILTIMIEIKGVKVKNPKPDHIYSDDPDENKSKLYQQVLREWELAEAEVKKVVIIKVKK